MPDHSENPHSKLPGFVTDGHFFERVSRFGAKSTLMIALGVSALNFAQGDNAADKKNERVIACADNLGDSSTTYLPDEMPEDCGDFSYEYSSLNDPNSQVSALGYVTYTFPPRRDFISENRVGEEYNKKVRESRRNTVFVFLGLSAALGTASKIKEFLEEDRAQLAFDEQEEIKQKNIDRKVREFSEMIERHERRNKDK